MEKTLVLALALLAGGISFGDAFSEKGTFFDSVKFIQYLDENTALEEVRNGNLDLYYYRVPSDRLEGQQAREGLHVFDSTGGSYSILVNPAESERFNPFSIRDVRFALNYLVDRKLIVNELMGGYGSPISSYYSPADPEFLTIVGVLERFNFRYNPTLANEIITKSLTERGATKSNGVWEIDSEPVEITIFIRSDDPIRKSIGELLSVELEEAGFVVKQDFGDLNKAFVIVYGSDPAETKWSLYTEGWSRSAFVRYDSVGLGQMYSPWFSNMPGFNDPTYWNYQNEQLDGLTQKIYTGDFGSAEERTQLIRDAVSEGIDESVRVFLASKTDQYVANKEISGAVNDFGAGVPSRFTPINSQGSDGQLTVGVKQIYQGAWNPVMGLTDSYSRHIWGIVSDPGTFKHPFTGKTIPVRTNWAVETAGPDGKIEVPPDAEMWNPSLERWEAVGEGIESTSSVTFDFEFGGWHHGKQMDINDILHSLYFTVEWGTQTDQNDKTFDAEFTPRTAQAIQTIKGVRQIDGDTVQVFVDYWHFDEGEIADWAELWSTVPWEITASMEKVVLDGKASFSRSGATSKNVSWLSLLIPNDAGQIRDNLEEFATNSHVPRAFEGKNLGSEYLNGRYQASSDWIERNQHAVISNGPFYLRSYSPESRTILVEAFSDGSYPLAKGKWSGFESPSFPTIERVEAKDIIRLGSESEIIAETKNSDSILYFLTNGYGDLVASGHIRDVGDRTVITVSPNDTKNLGIGANSIKIFAISDSVLKPDFYETSFIVSSLQTELPENVIVGDGKAVQEQSLDDTVLAVILVLVIIITLGLVIYVKKRSR